MSDIHYSVVERAHAYTHSKIPWQMEFDFGQQKPERRSVRRLFRYLSGGGMRTFGRTILQEERSLRRRRFLVVSGLCLAVWLVGYFI